MHDRRQTLRALVMTVALSLPTLAHAEDELAPGFNACTNKAESTAEIVECITTANDYWSKQLSTNYEKAMEQCNNVDKSASCKENLRKARQAWEQYTEAVSAAIWNLQEGSSKANLDSANFTALATKQFALILQENSE